MAVYWNLGAAFDDRATAEDFAAFFAERGAVPGPPEARLYVHLAQQAGLWLVGVWPAGMSWGSPKGDDPALTQPHAVARAEDWFFEQLALAPPFRAAMFGPEAYDAFLDEPLPWADGEVPRGSGLVLDPTWFGAFGEPAESEAFGRGYRWWPPARLRRAAAG